MDEMIVGLFSSQWRIVLFVGGFLLVLAELGFRLGLRLHLSRDEGRRSQIGNLQAAVLGMLALLLGFTFAMVTERYDTRRQLVVDSANAIGTAYLRTSFLPEPHRSEVRSLLRRYVDVRLDFSYAGHDLAEIEAVEERTAELQRQLWRHAEAVGNAAPTPLTAGFVTAITETIDLDTIRLAAMHNTVPGIAWVLLLLVAGCGSWATGYSAGAAGQRTAFAQAILPLLIAAVIIILVDFDHSVRGVVTVSQDSLLNLQRSLAAPSSR